MSLQTGKMKFLTANNILVKKKTYFNFKFIHLSEIKFCFINILIGKQAILVIFVTMLGATRGQAVPPTDADCTSDTPFADPDNWYNRLRKLVIIHSIFYISMHDFFCQHLLLSMLQHKFSLDVGPLGLPPFGDLG